MIEIFDANPFAEAMFYYWGRANEETVGRKTVELIKKFPTQREAIEKAAQPAAALEKMLDSKLKADERLINKYFRKIEITENAPAKLMGFCIAEIFLQSAVASQIGTSPEILYTYLKKMTPSKMINELCLNICTKYEVNFPNKNSPGALSDSLRKMQIDEGDKYRIIDTAFNYKTSVNELLALIMPAAKLIESAKHEYQNAVEEFGGLYSKSNAQELLESCFNTKLPSAGTIKVAPLILGFECTYGLYTTNPPKKKAKSDSEYSDTKISTFVGIAGHILKNRSVQDEVLALSEEMKILSDRTRLGILFYLCSHRAFGQELCNEFDIRHPILSYHLTKLLDANFITAEICGSKTYYEANKAGIQRMLDSFAEKIK